MEFIWKDGHKEPHNIGTTICGLHHNTKRPVSVEFTKDDLRYIVENGANGMDYLHDVFCSLSSS